MTAVCMEGHNSVINFIRALKYKMLGTEVPYPYAISAFTLTTTYLLERL